jgi:hypothetical protein
MPRTAVTQELKVQTRNAMTKVDTVLTLKVEGMELPSAEVLGRAIEKGMDAIRDTILESYKVVPPRTDTPVAQPYART